jgi:predicted secreted acid phosphatase
MRLAMSVSRARLAVIGALALALLTAGVAIGSSIQTVQIITPKTAEQVTNLDVLRLELKNYYGDPTGTGTFGADSNYAQEAASVATDGDHWLASQATAQSPSNRKAIVLDVDDTSLTTWNYEIFSNWAFNSGTNATYVLGQLFPATPGMVAMATAAADEGYAVFFITGRPASQEAATLGNLTSDSIGVDAGYPAPTELWNGEDGLFTKPSTANSYADYPDYLLSACATEISLSKSCTTIHYKSATRAHIESLGYDIVANFGDQWSDLIGGFADKTFKMPNPNYYLP